LASALSAYLPLTGGTLESSGSSNTLNINHSSGSGIALNISKNGNGEGLTIVKGSGSGNAMSVTGGLTSLVNLSLSTVANATGDFLTHSGSTINKRTPAQVLSDIGGQAALTNPITGTGTTNRLPKFTGATSIGNSNITDNGTIVSIETNATINSIPIGRGANGNIFSVSFGYESLIANTTGVSNTAIGAFTLFSNTTGDYNSAFGYSSLRNNTTGDYNSAFGYQALNENTTGSYNSAFGWYALGNNTTGSSNVGIGQYAGLFIENSSTPNSTSSNSVFIGVGTKALADAQTNQIVIGHNAIGAGSNTVTLGNSSIVTTILRGNVGIGTTSPSDKLSIGNGTESINVRVTGNNSGSASGSSINVGISGVTNISIGNKSAILGGSYDSTSLVFWGNGANLAFSNGSDRMIITNGGNVGINQTNPTQKLDVNGLINSTNGISVGGTGVSIVWTGTQAAYDAIATKSSTTIYFIQ
jgi:hypothetical protein